MLRKVIERTHANTTAAQLADAVHTFAGSGGGACDPGCIFVWARPTGGTGGADGGLVYEGDRLGGAVRAQGQAPPYVHSAIMATNHFLKLGAPPIEPSQRYPGALTCCPGCDCTFSSQFRCLHAARDTGHWTPLGLPTAATPLRTPLPRARPRRRRAAGTRQRRATNQPRLLMGQVHGRAAVPGARGARCLPDGRGGCTRLAEPCGARHDRARGRDAAGAASVRRERRRWHRPVGRVFPEHRLGARRGRTFHTPILLLSRRGASWDSSDDMAAPALSFHRWTWTRSCEKLQRCR